MNERSQTQSPRPRRLLIEMGKRYPGAWRAYDQFRAGRGVYLPRWPDYVYAPMAAAYAIVSGGGLNRVPPHLIDHVAAVAALSAWRVTQGIYRFDQTLYEALIDTPINGDLPCDVLRRMPEWCVYIETPGLRWSGGEVHGVFAHLEIDGGDGREELRLLVDADDALYPIPIHLGPWGLGEAIRRALDVSRAHAALIGAHVPGNAAEIIQRVAEPVTNLLLYLCADEAEIGDGTHRPSNPEPKRTKQGWRLFAADNPTTWEVGMRIGAALHLAQAATATGQADGTHARPRAHIRRAHWHTYRVGAGRVGTRLKWLPPIPVNVDDPGSLPAVVKPVR